MTRVRTWHLEAAAQALLYLGVIFGQFGTPWRPELLLAAGLWLLGRVASRQDRQRERYEDTNVSVLMELHAVECAAGTKLDLRLISLAFGLWGLTIGSWLTLADVAWTVAYPWWRRWYRGWDLDGAREAVLVALLKDGRSYGLELIAQLRSGEVPAGRSLTLRVLYPLLRSMERRQLVRSFEGSPIPERGGRPRRYYKLTHDGNERAWEELRARRVAAGTPRFPYQRCPQCSHLVIQDTPCRNCST